MNKKGFTLIELLVVIAIIALLLSIVLPSMKLAKRKTQTVICRSNLRQWFIVAKMSTQDNHERFQEGWSGTSQTSNWWMDFGRIYYGNVAKIRCCPTASNLTERLRDGTINPEAQGRKPFVAWGYQPDFFKDPEDYGSYGINGWVEDNKSAWARAPDTSQKFWRTLLIPEASQVPLFTDAQWIDAWPEPDHVPPSLESESWGGSSHFVRICQNRHILQQNISFMDSSVKLIGLKRLWSLKWHQTYNTGGPWTLPAANWPAWMKNAKSD